MSDSETLGNTPYKLPEGVQYALDFEQRALAEYKNRKPRCHGSPSVLGDQSCCMSELTNLQLEAVKALIASFPDQDGQ